MTWLPFICLGSGFIIGLQKLPEQLRKRIDTLINVALIVLMLTIGANIGVNETIAAQIGIIGLRSAVIAFCAIAGSVVLTLIAEKTVLPLQEVQRKIQLEGLVLDDSIGVTPDDLGSCTDPVSGEDQKTSKLVWIMPGSIIAGVLIGLFLIPEQYELWLGKVLAGSLVLLYTGVGVSMGANRSVFRYLKLLGVRILWLPLAICLGSLVGGAIAGLLLGMSKSISVLSAAGMSYYSITGAFMTQSMGAEAGIYGFLVNVFREFLTVLLLPLLVKLSKGSPIASGAAGNMDTMLVPVTRFVGVELGLVTLLTGTVLTFVVPFLLPFLLPLLTGVLTG